MERNLRSIFELNSLLHNIIDENLHACCDPGLMTPCVSQAWTKKILDCFLSWAKRMSKKKRDSPLISYLVGDAQTIDQIANQLSTSLEAYNTNFRKISHHNLQVDKNLNLLAKLGENLTQYDRYN